MKNRKKKRTYWLIALAAIVLIGGGYAVKTYTSSQAAESEPQLGTVSIGTVSSTISGSGSVRSSQNTTISWQTSGKVETVSVEMGQQVEEGQELAALDQASLSTSIIQAQADLIDAQEALEELKTPSPLAIAQAQSDLEEAKKMLENLLNPTGSALAAAELAVVTAQETFEDAQNAVDALNYPRANEGTIASAQANYLLALDKVDKMQGIYDHTEGDPNADAGKALALSNLQNAKNDASRSLATLNWYLGEPTEDEVATKNIELQLAQSELADAQAALEALKNPGEEDIVLAQAAVDEAEESLETARNGASESELILAQVRITTAEAELAQAVLTAPFAGTITEIDVLPGDIVSGGRSAFRIDDLSKLYIDLQVSEVDVLQVKTGQEAEIVFDAIDGKTYTGKVTKIGMVAEGSQGVVNYPVTVQLLDPDESILPGMTASVSIVVDMHEDVMVVPSQAVRTGVGQRTVTVLFEGEQISVPVTTGLTSDSMTEVSSDQLREGDTVVLNGTTGTTTSSQNMGMPGPMIIQGDFGERFEGMMP